jgi:hypothetical protein
VLASDALRIFGIAKKVRVGLSGCIKNSSRNFWEAKINDASDENAALGNEMERTMRTNINSRGAWHRIAFYMPLYVSLCHKDCRWTVEYSRQDSLGF